VIVLEWNGVVAGIVENQETNDFCCTRCEVSSRRFLLCVSFEVLDVKKCNLVH
jgi:hypothetical protein